MPFDIDPVYVIYLFVALAAGLLFEGIYLLFFNARSYRKNVNRRLQLMNNRPDREGVLVQLRRERGLNATGDYRLPLVALNRLILQSGLKLGIGKFAIYVGVLALFAFGLVMATRGELLEAGGAALFCCAVLPFLVLKFKRRRRQKKFGAQFPDALDIIVRSLRAGHPVPIAITMVAREMADPIGTEFGIVADEITYGADLETGMRNLYFRIGQEDLPLFVTAVAIQSSTGGNLGEILENLSKVIRERFKMRRKIRALASEGRASAMILSSLPILIFLVIQVVTPEFYASVWHEDLTKICLAAAGGWMLMGNLIMFRMVNFRI
ncbi:MAG: tight adherence protein [Alphaproteobacteria bacterium]|jgi:tight adherence protein B|nr:tight adherence protein [Alphaproteobacteria bacterium]MEA3027085.1 tight adherence protein [Alphaproteobacteria bacterium]